jgi:hypothetical protein
MVSTRGFACCVPPCIHASVLPGVCMHSIILTFSAATAAYASTAPGTLYYSDDRSTHECSPHFATKFTRMPERILGIVLARMQMLASPRQSEATNHQYRHAAHPPCERHTCSPKHAPTSKHSRRGYAGRLSSWLPWGNGGSGGGALTEMTSSPSRQADGSKSELSASEARQQLLVEMGLADDTDREEDQRDGEGDNDGNGGGMDPAKSLGMRLEFMLLRGSLTLVNNDEGDATERRETPIAMLTYKNLQMQVVTRLSSMEFMLQLANFVVTDLHTHDVAPGFHRVVSRYEYNGEGSGLTQARAGSLWPSTGLVTAAAGGMGWIHALKVRLLGVFS